jgi:large subunit ribosomal protein L33
VPFPLDSGKALQGHVFFGLGPWRNQMAKKSTDREYVWLQCTENGDLNYRTSIRLKGGIDEKVKAGFKKFSPRLRKHTLHKIKRK